MSTPYLGEIRIFSFNFAPRGWAFANGQLMAIQQNQALFSILGTTYGGNGVTNFALPNLQGASPVHTGPGYALGQVGGESAHTLLTTEMPMHNHTATASLNSPDQSAAANNLWAQGNNAYNASTNAAMAATAFAVTGGSQPHENTPPYLALNFSIALIGIFPSRN